MDNLSTFTFEGYNITDLVFTANPDYVFGDDPLDIDMQTNISVNINEELDRGAVTINCKLFEDAEEHNYPFSLKVSLTGYFGSREKMSLDAFTRFCEMSGTATLFPFLRGAVADITKTVNFPPLILPLINVKALVEEHRRRNALQTNVESNQNG